MAECDSPTASRDFAHQRADPYRTRPDEEPDSRPEFRLGPRSCDSDMATKAPITHGLPNNSRQPSPGVRLAACLQSLVRRGSAQSLVPHPGSSLLGCGPGGAEEGSPGPTPPRGAPPGGTDVRNPAAPWRGATPLRLGRKPWRRRSPVIECTSADGLADWVISVSFISTPTRGVSRHTCTSERRAGNASFGWNPVLGWLAITACPPTTFDALRDWCLNTIWS